MVGIINKHIQYPSDIAAAAAAAALINNGQTNIDYKFLFLTWPWNKM